MMNGTKSLYLAILLAGCGSQATQTPPLAGARIGGPFTLTSEDGKSLTDKSFEGKYRLIYFGFTSCADVCPVDTANLMRGLKALEAKDTVRAARIQPLFISFDPARDTPAKLAEFTDVFHPRLIGLTGTPAQIADVTKAFAIYFEKDPKTDQFAHQQIAYLMGPSGEPLAIIPHDGTPDAIAAELTRWTP